MPGNGVSRNPQFLTVEDVLRLHDLSIVRHGGSFGVRDEGLLESALAMPSQTFGGQYLHASLEEMAAAYLFHICRNHICRNHAFVDGNKRAALLACEAFLRLNRHELTFRSEEIEDITLRVAAGEIGKEELARVFTGKVQPLGTEEAQETRHQMQEDDDGR